MHTDLIGTRVHLTDAPSIVGQITGTDGADFLIVQFANGWEGRTSRKHAAEAVANGETPRAWIAPSSLATAARGARAMLDDIRAGKPVPSSGSAADVIAAWQRGQAKSTATAATKPGDKSADEIVRDWQAKQSKVASAVNADAQADTFKSRVKRGIVAQTAPAEGGAQVFTLVHRSGRRD